MLRHTYFVGDLPDVSAWSPRVPDTAAWMLGAHACPLVNRDLDRDGVVQHTVDDPDSFRSNAPFVRDAEVRPRGFLRSALVMSVGLSKNTLFAVPDSLDPQAISR